MKHALSTAFVVVALASCSSGAVAVPDAAPDAGSSACTDLATARCKERDACSAGLGTQKMYGDLATCVSRDALGCDAALHARGTSATSALFESCAQAIGAEACSDWIGNASPAACVPSPGARANGQPCTFHAQCASTWCATQKGRACGTCADVPKVGDACDATADCGRGLYCARSGACAAPVGAGGACDAARPCSASLTCVGEKPVAMVPGTCRAAGAAVGVACDPKHATAPGCDGTIGLACVGGACAKIQLVGAGAPCGALGDGGVESVAECAAGGACILAQGAKSGACVGPAADGAACDLASGPPCLSPARCVTSSDATTAGVCTLPSDSACN